MSSYFPSFSYTAPNGIKYNSYKDKNLIVTHFESGDSGEVDTFLGMDPIYADNAHGTRRLDYGAKYNNVAVIRISVMKSNGKDFTVAEVRDFLRWTTGSRMTSYLDLSDIVDDEEIVKASFLGRITSVYQQKLDARTIGFVIEHTSISPYAYSPIRYARCSFEQKLSVDDAGVLGKDDGALIMDGTVVLSDGADEGFTLDDGVLQIYNPTELAIPNDTDDLSDYVYLDMKLINATSDYLVVKNQTLYDESNGIDGITKMTGMHDNEVVTLSSGQFITSSSGRIFGDTFNFVWPKLLPGDNNFVISGSGRGEIEFMYRTPIKIGDCAMNVDVSGGGLCGGCAGESSSGYVTWDDIIGKPSTRDGYNLQDVYTKSEVNNEINNVGMSINEEELASMLDDVLK